MIVLKNTIGRRKVLFMTDEQIIDLFFERSEQAISELDDKYGKVLLNLSHNILNDRWDAEECVNDSYLGAWNVMPPVRPNPLLTFVCKIVRNISIKKYHAKTACKRNSAYDVAMSEVTNYILSPNNVEAEIEAKELAKIIEKFLDTLTVENRVIFMRRYWFSDTYKDIADRVGITEKMVSMRLTRIRKQMREYLVKKEVLV